MGGVQSTTNGSPTEYVSRNKTVSIYITYTVPAIGGVLQLKINGSPTKSVPRNTTLTIYIPYTVPAIGGVMSTTNDPSAESVSSL